MTGGIVKTPFFKKVKPVIFAERDGVIYKHLKEEVFPPGRSALLACAARGLSASAQVPRPPRDQRSAH